jgi:hypothetical protein
MSGLTLTMPERRDDGPNLTRALSSPGEGGGIGPTRNFENDV